MFVDTHWRVKDGLFIGNKDASEDLELMVENKITRIVNCCGWSVSNSFESMGLTYLTYKWTDVDRQVILDDGDSVINDVFSFIEDALDRAEGILVHSVNGHSRSCCVVIAYMMRKHKWCLKKTLDFLKSRHPYMNIRNVFHQQLEAYERRLKQRMPKLSLDWDSPLDEAEATATNLESEELMLRNTFVNSMTLEPPSTDSTATGGDSVKLAEQTPAPRKEGQQRKLLWLDGLTDDRPKNSNKLEKPAGADKHNAARCPRDAGGDLVLTSALKASSAAGAEKDVTITIRSKRASGLLHCKPNDLVPERFGLQLQRRAIILEYTVPRHGIRAHHTVPVDLNGAGAGATGAMEDVDAAIAERLRQLHAPWLASVSAVQLRQLVHKLRIKASSAEKANGSDNGIATTANGHERLLDKK